MDGHINNFKLGGNYQRRVDACGKGFLGGGGQISPSPIDFHRSPYNTLALPCERVITQERISLGDSNLVGIIDVGVNAEINVIRRQIAESLQSNKKSGSANRTAVSKFTPEVHK